MSLAAAKYAQLANSLNQSICSSSTQQCQLPPELENLTAEEIDILDAVIDAATPSATSFLTVFKAYHDVLTKRGLDPHEVVLYGKLLKIGTLKGLNWGDKWNNVKQQQARMPQPPKKLAQAPATQKTQGKMIIPVSDSENEFSSPVNHSTPNRARVSRFALPTPATSSQSRLRALTKTPSGPQHTSTPTHHHHNHHQHHAPAKDTSDDDFGSGLGQLTPLPTSKIIPQRSTQRSSRLRPSDPKPALPTPTPTVSRSLLDKGKGKAVVLPQPAPSPTSARQVIAQARQRRGSAIDEDSAWNKIRQARDEEEADAWRDDRLLDKSWRVWRAYLSLVKDEETRIDAGRSSFLLKKHFSRWRQRTTDYHHASSMHAHHLYLRTMLKWKERHRRIKVEAWRTSMRTKMGEVKLRSDALALKSAWGTWRFAYRLRCADAQYSQSVAVRCLGRWRERVDGLAKLVEKADVFWEGRAGRVRESAWEVWKRAVRLRGTERLVDRRVALGLVGRSFEHWKQKSQEYEHADSLYGVILLKQFMTKWRVAQSRIRAMEARADKHASRQDDLLIRAVARVWKAKERGHLLHRVKSVRTQREVVDKWRFKMKHHEALSERALTFYTRPSSSLLTTAFTHWRHHMRAFTQDHRIAAAFQDKSLLYRALARWRAKQQQHAEMQSAAAVLRMRSAVRSAWGMWRARLEASKREAKVREWERRVVKGVLREWWKKTKRQRQCKMAEEMVRFTMQRRIMKHTLDRWTNRVIDLKLRELEVIQRYDTDLTMRTFKKWKSECERHVETLNLLESYQFVKREELMKRVFHRWLTTSRALRKRKLVLREQEEEMKVVQLANAWEKWRDRFCDLKLQPIETSVATQMQTNLLWRAFGVWHAKTNSLPAIRFHASHVKANAWRVWRAAMPRALQAKQAREAHRKSVLTRFMGRWSEAYQKKLALKAVARARYLRLPTTSPRKTLSSAAHPSVFPRSAPRLPALNAAKSRSRSKDIEPSVTGEETDATDSDADEPLISPPIFNKARSTSPERARFALPTPAPSTATTSSRPLMRARTGLTALLDRPAPAPRKTARSEASPTRPSFRELSPTRSSVGARAFGGGAGSSGSVLTRPARPRTTPAGFGKTREESPVRWSSRASPGEASSASALPLTRRTGASPWTSKYLGDKTVDETTRDIEEEDVSEMDGPIVTTPATAPGPSRLWSELREARAMGLARTKPF